jgi:hypothetical protein
MGKISTRMRSYVTPTLLGGVGHCFAWHVRVSLGLFQFNFKTEELVHSVLCAM